MVFLCGLAKISFLSSSWFESYDAHNLRRKKDKQKTLHFPKINSIYRNNALQESEKNLLTFETKSRFPDNGAIKIYKGSIDDESGNIKSILNIF